MLRSFSAALALLCQLILPAAAQDVSRSSECLAMTNAPPRTTPVSLRSAAAKTDEVAITYAGHSTYYIKRPQECGSRPTIVVPTRRAACRMSSP